MRVFNIVVTALAAAAVSAPMAGAQVRPGPQTEQRVERVQMPRPGRVSLIGVRLSDVQPDQVKAYKLSKPEGAVVEAVNPNSPAATAGLREKDVIVEFDEEHVRSASHLARLVAETPVGRDVAIAVMRDGRKTNLRLKTEGGNAAGWFDPTFGGAIDPLQMRDLADQAGRVAREMGVDFLSNRGRLGVSVQDVTPELAEYFGVKSGVLVVSVSPDSPAAKAGLKAGDVITAVDGKTVSSPGDLMRALPTGEGAHEVAVAYVRDKQQHSAKALLEPRAPRNPPRRTGQPV
ncbi:MAG: PDZ domain-containing protein [Vicinamibacterales bacterium]|nr:PDZ domain-containing protein [Vicinamibacterales bacterium]